MGRCFGLTKNLHRCARKSADRSMFCHEHSLQPLVWIFVLIFTVLPEAKSIYSVVSSEINDHKMQESVNPPKVPSSRVLDQSNDLDKYFSTPKSARESLSQYEGDGNIHFEQYDLGNFLKLKATLNEVNAKRIEFPERALEVSVVQHFLDSGNFDMALFSASELVKKQDNLHKVKK